MACNHYHNNVLTLNLMHGSIKVSSVHEYEQNVFVTYDKGIKCIHRISQNEKGYSISTQIENPTNTDICPENLQLLGGLDVFPGKGFDKCFIECRDILSYVGPQPFDRLWQSYGIAGLMDDCGNEAVLLGFDDGKNYLYGFQVEKKEDCVTLSAFCEFEKTPVKAGQTITLSDISIYTGEKLSLMLEAHAQKMADTMKARRQDSVKTGWCSWYHYYSTESCSDILDNMNELAHSGLPHIPKVILIDDGWNLPDNSSPCLWGDWYAGGKFSEGMKDIADRIHEKGFEAGLWLAPFAVSKHTELFKNNPEMIVGKGIVPSPTGGDIYSLDLTHPKSHVFLKETFNRVFTEWGFDFVKIDFLIYALLNGERYDNTVTTVAAFQKGLEIIRECAGDKFILNCGSPIFSSIGYCDGMRIGTDVGSQFYFPLNEGLWQFGNCAVKPCVRYTANRQWMHGHFWQNDPDCIVAREKCNGIEDKKFAEFFPELQIMPEQFGLTKNEAELWAKMVWFTGGMWLLSEHWSEVSPERQKLIEKFCGSNINRVRLLDYYENPEVIVMLGEGEKQQLAVFNVSDRAQNISIPARQLGIEAWNFEELFGSSVFSGSGREIQIPQINARTGVIYQTR